MFYPLHLEIHCAANFVNLQWYIGYQRNVLKRGIISVSKALSFTSRFITQLDKLVYVNLSTHIINLMNILK